MSKKVLVVDDERSVAEVMGLYLERDGYTVQIAYDGRAALQAIRDDLPDLVVLDLMIPEIDGLAIIRHLREEGVDVPIVVLSAKQQEVDRIHGLQLGADDYVTKPFSPAEVVARVNAVLRRAKPKEETPAQAAVSFDNDLLTINPKSYEVKVDGKKIDLTSTEFNLLWFMAQHPSQVFSRKQLLDSVWGFSDFVDSSTVTVHIRRLREKLEPDPAKPRWLMTVWGVGYKFETREIAS